MFKRIIHSSGALRLLLNVYPPYLGARIKTTFISKDFRTIRVEMPLGIFNRNVVGTHFGGSLFSMTDPFFALIFIRNLGPQYVVWDLSSQIDFRSPGIGRVFVEFSVKQSDIDLALEKTRNGAPYRPSFTCQIRGENNDLVAELSKTLYIRKKPEHV